MQYRKLDDLGQIVLSMRPRLVYRPVSGQREPRVLFRGTSHRVACALCSVGRPE